MKTDKLFNSFLTTAILLLSFFLSNKAIAGTIQLPKTGQTKCYYKAAGYEFDCSGTRQDGDIQAGVAWPNPRFTDYGDGTVTDKLTGLMWIKEEPINIIALTWQEALDYVKTLNTGGHTDWRLPNVLELKSLVDYSQYEPALPIGHPFTNLHTSYWSSTTYAGYPSYAWYVHFGYGDVYGYDKSGSYYVRAVRGGQCGLFRNSVICLPQSGQTECYNTADCAGTGDDGDIQSGVAWPSPRFVNNYDGTVTDKLTGLMWEQEGKATAPWQEALDYVKTLNTGGHTDWRLPNINELRSLIDYSQHSPSLPQGHPFTTNFLTGYWWSSTTCAKELSCAWGVDFSNNGSEAHEKRNEQGWRAVRVGGPSATTTLPCAAEAIYGSDSEETELLREYRDKVLSKSAKGRQMIKTYYELSPAVVEVLQQNDPARASTRRVLDSIMPTIKEKVKQ